MKYKKYLKEKILEDGKIREIGEHDREFFYRNERIDWENLK